MPLRPYVALDRLLFEMECSCWFILVGTPFLLECNSGCDWESMFGVRYAHETEPKVSSTYRYIPL